MQMLYNSDNFAVVQIDMPGQLPPTGTPYASNERKALSRGGYEIVDKFARKEIYIEGVLAESFEQGVTALIETSPSEEEMDDYIARYTSLMHQPVILH